MIFAFSWGKKKKQKTFVSLWLASFCTPRPNLPVTPSISWLPIFCIPVPYNEKGFFFWVLVLDLVGHHRTVQLQLLQQYWLGIDLDYCDIEWFALEMNRDHFIVYEIASKYCISDSFVNYNNYSISSKGFLPAFHFFEFLWRL